MADQFTPAQEAALLRTLRDISDGHIHMGAAVQRYDAQTGELLEWDIVTPDPAADRAPAAAIPNPTGDWWAPMLRRGWVSWVASGRGRCRLRVELPGIDALKEAGMW